jgi:diguanylate cyclase (GGDEF)-like protein
MYNLHKYEKFIRATLGLTLIFLAQGIFNPISILGVIMITTAITGHCPLYKLLHVNDDLALKNEFLLHLPQNNPEPVFVFCPRGNIIFQNQAAKEILPEIISFKDVSPKSPNELIKNAKNIASKLTYKDKTYLIKARGIKEKKYILAYGFNITDIQKSKDALKLQTITDPLTNLGNRAKLIQDIQGQKGQSKLVLILIDLAKFSQINSFFGHEKGDEFLKTVAKTLENFQKNSLHVSSIYRLRGNTFALLLNFGKTKDEDINKIQLMHKDKIFELFESFKIEFDELSTNTQINVALAKSNDKEGEANLLNHAETALSEAKKGSLKFLCYSDISNINERYKQNLHWAGKLYEIFHGNAKAKIVAYFQPIYNLQTQKIEKYESLVRIIDGSEVISPFHFLDIAKQINFLPKITKEVFKQALEKFQNTSYEFSINITTQDLLDKDFGNYMARELEKKGLSPASVVLEILEDEDMYEHISAVQNLKEAGFKIAVDDFGTGYSNFQKLQQLQLDYIKIDGSLIKNIASNNKDYSIVNSICNYAKTIGVKTIAEFVASEEILKNVKNLQIDYAQGYHIGEPSPSLKDRG